MTTSKSPSQETRFCTDIRSLRNDRGPTSRFVSLTRLPCRHPRGNSVLPVRTACAGEPCTSEAAMHCSPLWNVESTKILTRRELATVLADLKGKTDRQANVRRNLVIVRLACCCGLRVSEIGGLQLDDLILDVARPHMRLRRETTKGNKARCVPARSDPGTPAHLLAWNAPRLSHRSPGRHPFPCSLPP